MIDPIYLNVLRRIHGKLSEEDVNWAISLGLALQSVPVEVHDIDIQTDEKGAYKIEILFFEFVIKKVVFSSAEKIRSHFGALMINGIKVEIMRNAQKNLEMDHGRNPLI